MKSLALHWSKGTAEFLPLEFGPVLVNTADVDYSCGIRDRHSVRRSVTSHIHLLDGVIVACEYKNQSITTLHSTGSEITSLTSGVKKTNHIRDFASSLGYHFGAGTSTLNDSQVTILPSRHQCILYTQLHKTSCYQYIVVE
jgi:hypothetical protein